MLQDDLLRFLFRDPALVRGLIVAAIRDGPSCMTSRRTRLRSGTAACRPSCAGASAAGTRTSGAFIDLAGGAPGGLAVSDGRRAAVEQRLAAVSDDRKACPIIGMRRLLIVHQAQLRSP